MQAESILVAAASNAGSCLYMHILRFVGAVQVVVLIDVRCGVIDRHMLRRSICCRVAQQEDSVLCICAAFMTTTICLLDCPSAEP